MRIHGLVIAACVLLILGAVLYWSNRHQTSNESSKISADTSPAILKLDQAAITKLELKKRDAEPLSLIKASSGEWQIIEPKPLRADQSAVSGVLSTLSSLNSQRIVEDKASDLRTFGLQSPSLEVDLTQKNNQSEKLLLGDETPASNGIYAMLAGDPRVFTMASWEKSSIDKGLNDLRDKRLLPISPDKISRVELLRSGQDIEFGRNKDEWQILKPKPLRADSTQVGELVRLLTEAKMDLSSSEAKDAASAFREAKPLATAKLTDESGIQEFELRKSKDTYYAKSSAVDGAYKVDSELGKALDKSVDDFRNKKLFDFSYGDPNKIDLRTASKSQFLVRGSAGSEDWWANGKKMNAESVDSLISDLRDLSASKFPDAGFSTPDIEATVISDDGKRTEKVQIAKAGDHYIAKRENEPALYQLDSKSVEDLVKAADDIKPENTPPSGTSPSR
jgi:Domain of unknown function (DUF4340)